MLDFRTPTLADKERIDSFTRDCGQIGCDITFANTYLWRERYSIRIAFDDDTYYKCYAMGGKVTGYSFPLTHGDIHAAVEKLFDDAKERGVDPFIGLLSTVNAELLQRGFENRIADIHEDRNSFDYIYEREHLANLVGKKYHAKRNHVSRFKRNYDNYSVKELNRENFDDAYSVALRWLDGNEDTGELNIIRDALDHFEELGMFGLVLYVRGKPVAMCMASEINDRVCDVNFEKAVEIDEAYAVINNEFAKRFDKYTLVNREEDMGLEGLRKAKLSYHPDILYSKSHAKFL